MKTLMILIGSMMIPIESVQSVQLDNNTRPRLLSQETIYLKESRIGNGQFWAGTICLGGYVHTFTTKDTYDSTVSHEQLFVTIPPNSKQNSNNIPILEPVKCTEF